MDIDKWIQNRGRKEIPNPQYIKKNGLPPTIVVPDIGPDNSPLIHMALSDAHNAYSISAKEAEKYNKFGINYSPNYQNIDAQLADAQSGWSKMANALGQTIWSEIALGTLKGFTDLADFVSSNILHLTEDDYQNPASETIQQWQDYYNNEVAPIYTNPDVDIQNGGLTDVGWYAKNIPSIASSLTLFLPGAGATKGLSWLAKASVKGMSIAKATGNARRWLSGVRKGQSFAEMRRAAKFANNPLMIARANEAAKIGSQALLMRTMENYQEARDVHQQTYQDTLDNLMAMDDETYAEWINNNAGVLSEGVDPNNRDAVAKDIAKKAADRTFAMDYSNLIFDVIQLYGLKDFGKGMKAITGGGVANAERQAIAAAEELATGTAAKQAERGLLTRIKEYGTDVAKDFGKSFLEESTEGIEEAVNAIAQDEGITYGKMLLEGNANNYQVDGIGRYLSLGLGDVINTWRYLQNPLNEYLASAELQESAFWGVLGGMVFGAGASGMQKGKLAYDRYIDNKRKQKRVEDTGESTNAVDATGTSFTELFELPEQKAAKLAIQRRIEKLKTYQSAFKEIEEGKDIFAPFNEDKTIPMFTGTTDEINLKKAEARAKLERQFVSEIAMEAMNTGTFDSLLEYFSNDKVKQAMVQIGMISQEDADTRVEAIKKQLQNVQKLYNDNAAHLFAQASYLNAIGKEDIPIEYLNIIAKNNTDRMLDIEELDAQIEVLSQRMAELEGNQSAKDIAFNAELYRAHSRIQALTNFYGYLRADEEALERDKDKIDIFDYERRKRHINEMQKEVLGEIASITTQNAIDTNQNLSPLANVFHAIRQASKYYVPIGTEYDANKKRYSNYINAGYRISDENIIKELEKLFKDGWLDGKLEESYKNLNPDTIIQQGHQLAQQIDANVGNSENSLAATNAQLYSLYQQLASKQLHRRMYNSRIVETNDDILNEVDYLHNSMNKARAKAVDDSTKGLIDLYKKYENRNKDFFDAVVNSYHKNKVEARRLAESIMSKDDANKFMSYMDIFNFTSTTNNRMFDMLAKLFNTIKAVNNIVNTQRTASESEDENQSTSINAPQSTENQPTNNSSQQPQNAGTTPSEGQIEPQNNQNQQLQTEKPRKNTTIQVQIRRDGVVSFSKTRKPNGNTMQAYEYEDGTIEIETTNLTDDNKLRVVRSNLFDIKGLDLMATDWTITKNPTIVYDESSKKYVVKEQGEIDDVSNVSTPVEGNTTQPVSTESPITGSTVTFGSTVVPNATVTFGPSITETTEQSNIAPVTEAPPISSTGVETETPQDEGLTEDAVRNLQNAIGQTIQSLFDKVPGTNNIDFVNTNIDNVAQVAHDVIFTENAKNTYGEELLTMLFNNSITSLRNIQERLRRRNSPIENAGAALAYQASVEESNAQNRAFNSKAEEQAEKVNFTPIFSATVTAFMEEYSKIVPYESSNGKQIVRLEDILRVCHRVYGGVNSNAAQSVYDILTSYFTSPEGQQKYEVIDEIESRSALERINKSPREVILENNSGEFTAERIDLSSVLDDIKLGREDVKQAIDSLQEGDEVLVRLERRPNTDKSIFVITKGDIRIGEIPLPDLSVDGGYIKVNSGWITEINVDKYGNPVSDSMDLIIDMLTSSEPSAQELRNLLLNYKLSEGADNDAVIQAFANNPIISAIVQESIMAVDEENPNYTQRVFVDYDTLEVDYNRLISYLARLYRYSTQTADVSSEEYNIQIADSIKEWYSKLYKTYNTMWNLAEFGNYDTSPLQTTIAKVHESPTIRLFADSATRNNYNSLPYSNEGIANLDNARIACADPNEIGRIRISGKEDIEKIGVKPGSISVILDNDKNYDNFVLITGLLGTDEKQDEEDSSFRKMLTSSADTAVASLVDLILNPTTTNIQKTINTLQYIVMPKKPTSKDAIPLFKSKYNGRNFFIEPLRGTNEGFHIRIVEPKEGIPDVKHDLTVYTKRNGVSGIEISDSTGKANIRFNGSNAKDILDRFRRTFGRMIQQHCCVNVDVRGIINDNQQRNIQEGFITFKDGKFVVNIPGGELKLDDDGRYVYDQRAGNASNYHEERSSYSEWLLKDGLVKVNTKIGPNGTNKISRSENQLLNQRIEVNLPTVTINRKANIPNEVIESSSNGRTFNNLKDAINTDSHQKGIELMSIALGQSEVDRLRQLCDDINSENDVNFDIFDLLPKELDYDPRYNYYKADGTVLGAIASSSGNNEQAQYDIYDDNGVRHSSSARLQTGNRSNIVVGTYWLNMASANILNADRRRIAIRKLIHENLHNKLGENKEAKDVLLKRIKTIYERFEEQLNKDFAANPNNPVLKHLKEALRGYKNERLWEEFLVESLTNKAFYEYLNNIQSDEKLNDKPKSLLNLILDAIAKFFGWSEVKDYTLLAKEMNVLKEWTDILSNKKEESPSIRDVEKEQKANTEQQSVASEINNNVSNNNVNNESVQAAVDAINIIVEDAREEEMNDVSVDKEIFNIRKNDEMQIKNYDGFISNLPIEAKDNIEGMVENGILSITCK